MFGYRGVEACDLTKQYRRGYRAAYTFNGTDQTNIPFPLLPTQGYTTQREGAFSCQKMLPVDPMSVG
jgi:hypothetical protein